MRLLFLEKVSFHGFCWLRMACDRLDLTKEKKAKGKPQNVYH